MVLLGEECYSDAKELQVMETLLDVDGSIGRQIAYFACRNDC